MSPVIQTGRTDPCPCGSGKRFKNCCRGAGGDRDQRHGPGALAVPAVSWIYTQAALSLFDLRLPAGSQRWFELSGTFPDEKRNRLVRRFLSQLDLGWIYFSDSDHVVPPDTVIQLLESGDDIVSALYFSRSGRMVDPGAPDIEIPEHSPEMGLNQSRDFTTAERVAAAINGGQGVVDVDWVGAGALLVRRHVFEQLPAPWFFRDADGGENEDVKFCEKARAGGFRIRVNAGVVVGHVQAIPVGLPLAAPEGAPR